ncbi:MAG: TSUP family transporter, partial [Planctomycetota bacterium]
MGELTLYQWVGAGVAALLVGLSKAGFGAGAGLLAVPLMTAVLGATDMLPVMLLVLIIGDVFSLLHYANKHDRRNLGMLVPGLVLGVAAGYFVLDWFLALADGELWLRRGVGFCSVGFVGVQFYRTLRARQLGVPGASYQPRLWHGVGLGAAGGLTSTLAHAGGPFIALFLLPQKLGNAVFVGTVIKCFFIANLIKLIPYFRQGLMTTQNALLSVTLLPCVVLGTVAGVLLNRSTGD